MVFHALCLVLVLLPALSSSASINDESRNLENYRTAPGDLEKIDFLLYTRDARAWPKRLPHDLDHLDEYAFDASKKTYVLVHGWNSDSSFFDGFVNRLLDAEDCNLIGVDWSVMSEKLNYFRSAKDSLSTGTYAGQFLARLVERVGLKPAMVHAIGHSLGAQAVGELGRTVHQLTGAKLARVTGLDPAKPYFDVIDKDIRLNKNDGNLVDVIHTNSGNLWDGCLSFPSQLGHVDFYPAGGSHQPGCSDSCTEDCDDGDLFDMFKGCSHGRSVSYFLETIGSDRPFVAVQCEDHDAFLAGKCQGGHTEAMGMHLASTPVEGKYFLDVNEASPFSLS